ncbi:MAG: MCE family protein [Actinobacteria bacterium]|nr:MCE family protein [Actinomycetota bacterium]
MLRRSTKIQLLIFVVITLLGLTYVSSEYIGLTKYITGDNGCQVSADFPDSGGIFTSAEVTYRGVTVGKVGSLSLIQTPNPGVRVTLDLDSCSSPKIPSNVTATVADRSVIGEQYVNLAPPDNISGSYSGPYLEAGVNIPMNYPDGKARNQIPVASQTLLTNIDRLVTSVGVGNLQTVVSELDKAVAGRGADLGSLLDATDQLLDAASQPANLQATTDLIDSAGTVLQTQLDESQPLQVWTHDLNLLSQQLKTSDPDIQRLLTSGPSDLQTVDSFIRDNQTDIGVTLANLTTVGSLLTRHLNGLEQILELYPALAAGGPAALRNGVGNLGLILQASTTPQDCEQGYGGTVTRDPSDTSPIAPNVAAHCSEPNSGSKYTNVRGSANIPGGDPMSTNYDGTAYPRALTQNTVAVGSVPTTATLGDASWLGLLTDALH